MEEVAVRLTDMVISLASTHAAVSFLVACLYHEVDVILQQRSRDIGISKDHDGTMATAGDGNLATFPSTILDRDNKQRRASHSWPRVRCHPQ